MRIIGRAGHLVLVVLLVSLGVTALADLLPGSPALAVLGENATPEQIDRFNHDFGFDEPLLVRYWHWLTGVFTGDFGESIRGSGTVLHLIGQRVPVTIELAVAAIVLTLVIAVPLALVCAERQGGWLDRVATGITSALVSIPSFVLALVLVALVAVQLRAAPVAGWVEISDRGLTEHLRYLILPAVTLALIEAAVLFRVLRADAITTLGQNYVLAARARGMGRVYVMFRHVLRPSSVSTVTMLGLSVGRLLGGAVIVEVIFALPGIGSLAVQSIYSKDIVVVQGIVVVIAVAYVLINALIDAIYPLLDPRVRSGR